MRWACTHRPDLQHAHHSLHRMHAVDKDPSLVKGAWVLILECDYVWMKPMKAPDAYDLSQPGLQYHFDYIQVRPLPW